MLKGYAYFLPLRYCISELVDTAWVMNIQWVNWSISFCYNYFMDINNLSHKKILKGQDMEFSVFTRFFLNDQYQCRFKSMRKLSILWTICNKETLYKKKKKKGNDTCTYVMHRYSCQYTPIMNSDYCICSRTTGRMIKICVGALKI